MISALRKIEGRGELAGATSSVMELCVDNPREGLGELFDTHPSVDSRVAALVKYAGGHDPGPIALPPPPQDDAGDNSDSSDSDQPPPGDASSDVSSGPWGSADGSGGDANQPQPPPLPSAAGHDASTGSSAGPWGPHTDR